MIIIIKGFEPACLVYYWKLYYCVCYSYLLPVLAKYRQILSNKKIYNLTFEGAKKE